MISPAHVLPKEQSPLDLMLREPETPPEQAGRMRARQLEDTDKLSLVMMMANLLNTAVVLASFWNTGADNLLAIWGFAMCMACSAIVLNHIRSRDRRKLVERSADAIERYARVTFVFGLLWAMTPIIVMPFVDPMGQMALGVIMTGMLFAGAFLLSRIPQAAASFVIPITLGVLISLQMVPEARNDYLSVLTIIYVFVLWIAIRWNHSQFVSEFLGRSAIAEQSQLIGLLLRDFEESTSDWLWQTDEEGRLVELPLGLNEGKGQSDVMMLGESLTDLFADTEARTVLSKSLERRKEFRDLVLKVKSNGQERWWSVTGRPLSENGFHVGFRGVVSDVTQSKKAEDRVSYMAHYDGLTGLPNRATLTQELEKCIRQPVEPGRERALLWIDLDNFKWVNDTLGHPVGDELLRVVADRLSDTCEPDDVIARLGGDEFAIIVERDAGGELKDQVDRLSDVLNQPYNLFESTAQCGASLGVRVFDHTVTNIDTMLKQADLALYRAKNDGKGRWFIFNDELEHSAQRRRQIETDLHRALENNELRVYFQPLLGVNGGRIVAVETLLRWIHPERGMIYPGEFIEHAEDSGLISRLGDWVIRAALAEARRLPDDVRIAINISPLQIHSTSLFSTIVNALATNGIASSRLELEITETVLMADTSFTLERLHRLKELGVRIALDDFGTGYSSLSYLRAFPFDKIKIDKSFVSDLEYSDDSRAITVATLRLAQSLGMSCTAEGVETDFQKNFLSNHGCDELQGYLVSRPQPIDKLAHLLDLKTSDTFPAENDNRPRLRIVASGGDSKQSVS